MISNKANIQLVLGGSRSGKSAVAEKLTADCQRRVTYVATYVADSLDTEMAQRIQRHQAQRPSSWGLIENEFNLESIARQCSRGAILIDCLTMWLSFKVQTQSSGEILDELRSGLKTLLAHDVHTIIVSNELGMGLVPVGVENRSYRDLVGWANQEVANVACDVYFTVAGVAVKLKSNHKTCNFIAGTD